ncbi:MAG: ABC transporter substrate-binding protein [Notoacmeibacter sp.]|nr:ABC transporter substrate-binding protein [Notoacmeibacter sp.]
MKDNFTSDPFKGRLKLLAPTRRGFLMAASAAAGGLLLSGLPLSSARAAGAPVKGGRMKIAMGHGATGDTLDPALLFNGFQWTASHAMRNALTQIGPSGKLEPCLATGWDSTDAKSWVFTLRQGVEFHNGKTLDQDDVIASINHHLGPDSKSGAKVTLGEISGMKKDGSDKIVITLNAPNADFPNFLASGNAVICPAKSEGGIDWESNIGTGGYLLKRYEPGVTAEFTRNPNYWRDDRAFAEEVELLTILDTAARTNALLSGIVDVIDKVDVKTASLLKRNSDVVVEATQGPLHNLFSMLSDIAPFNDNNVRLALKYAVDRQEILDKVLGGYGMIGNDQPIGPSYQYFDPTIEQRSYDPDKARFHLRQAGLDTLEVALSASDAAYSGAVDAAVIFSERAAPAGININVVREPSDGYWSNVWMAKPFYTNYWGGYTTESEMFQAGYMPDAAWNDSHFQNERFVGLLQEAKAALDPARRKELFSELQRIVSDEGGQIIPVFPQDVLARNHRVGHGELGADRGMDGRHIIERWWVEG